VLTVLSAKPNWWAVCLLVCIIIILHGFVDKEIACREITEVYSHSQRIVYAGISLLLRLAVIGLLIPELIDL